MLLGRKRFDDPQIATHADRQFCRKTRVLESVKVYKALKAAADGLLFFVLTSPFSFFRLWSQSGL
jgi:hypothetical protein